VVQDFAISRNFVFFGALGLLPAHLPTRSWAWFFSWPCIDGCADLRQTHIAISAHFRYLDYSSDPKGVALLANTLWLDFSAGSDANFLSLSASSFSFCSLFLFRSCLFLEGERTSRQQIEWPTTNGEWAGGAHLSSFYSTVISCDRSVSLSQSLTCCNCIRCCYTVTPTLSL